MQISAWITSVADDDRVRNQKRLEKCLWGLCFLRNISLPEGEVTSSVRKLIDLSVADPVLEECEAGRALGRCGMLVAQTVPLSGALAFTPTTRPIRVFMFLELGPRTP